MRLEEAVGDEFVVPTRTPDPPTAGCRPDAEDNQVSRTALATKAFEDAVLHLRCSGEGDGHVVVHGVPSVLRVHLHLSLGVDHDTLTQIPFDILRREVRGHDLVVLFSTKKIIFILFDPSFFIIYVKKHN